GDSADGAQTIEQEVDYLELAKRLFVDGNLDRASTALSQVDLNREGVDKQEYYRVKGLLRFKLGDYKEAITAFEEAIFHGYHDDDVFVFLAQCYYSLQDWERTILSVQNAENKVLPARDGSQEGIPELILMKAHAEVELDRRRDAWSTLSRGAKLFEDKLEFKRQKTFLLIDLGLYQAAVEQGKTYLSSPAATPDDYIALAIAFGKGDEIERAKVFLELARLKFPDSAKAAQHLSQKYIETGHFRAAGDLLQMGAELEPKLAQGSAEMFKRAGEYQRSLYMNQRVKDQKEKFKQRVGVLVDQQEFERVASMTERLRRLGLLDDQSVLYAVAYATFQVGRYDEVEPYLKKISDPTYFEYATQLRRLLAVCKKNPSQCG
ncbi:MAG: tetratricopeptide repeat protein, partial [Myxococcota bacterium]